MKTLDKILKARSILILDHPFFGSLALRFDLIEDNSLETAMATPKEIHYNPKYIESLSPKETTEESNGATPAASKRKSP